MRTPMAAPRAATGAARAATIAAERSSWMPPANRICSSAAASGVLARKSPRTPSWASQSGKLVRGPTWPPHSEPSKTNLRAPAIEELLQQAG